LATEASSGDAFAQFFIASLYLGGKGVTKDESVGVWWLQQSAKNGFSRAQLVLGQGYETGKLLPQDTADALNWYTKAAEQRDCEAELFLGLHYLGHHFDMEDNSWNYKGPKDTAKAIFWLQRAAGRGDPDAQVELGQLYEDGEAVVQVYGPAVFWYREAANHGPDLGGAGQGRSRLGNLYFDGRGVPKDYVEAYKWFALAGHKAEEQVATRMNQSELKEGKRRVEDWRQRHALEVREADKVFARANSE